jgi:hypothetical protein
MWNRQANTELQSQSSNPELDGGRLAVPSALSYIAVFFVLGFRPGIAPFEVVKGGASQLSISLYSGGCP